ncbi:hypothetical protein [Nonomuraea candida]|uniref:hypothetical protein n=1 Tax=Nonomuraea candida TaxID=359159 RepID=UPI0005BC4E92|nr:hypothetical protein [Nonomuraea candida]
MTVSVRPIGAGDLPVVTRVLTGSWGDSTVIALGRGELVDAAKLPGFIAEVAGEVAGVVTYASRLRRMLSQSQSQSQAWAPGWGQGWGQGWG